MRFKDLPVGHTFEFDNSKIESKLGYRLGFPSGPWVKDSARKYHGHTLNCHVGSVNVEVTDLTK